MAKDVNFGQIIVRSNPRDSLLLHTSQVSVVFFIPSNNVIHADGFNLPSGYQTAAVTTSLNLFLQPVFRNLNSNATAISDPESEASNTAILTKTHLYLQLQQDSFYSYGLPAISRAEEHEPRFVSIPIGSKQPSPRVRNALRTFGPTTVLVSTGRAQLRLPPSVESQTLLRQHEIERKTKVIHVPGNTILHAETILNGQGEEDTLDLMDQVQEFVYKYDASSERTELLSSYCAPKITDGVQVLITTYEGYSSSPLVNECLQAARKSVQQLCTTNQSSIWAAILAVPPSTPLIWRNSLSPKSFSQNKASPFQSGTAEMFIITRGHCVSAQMKPC